MVLIENEVKNVPYEYSNKQHVKPQNENIQHEIKMMKSVLKSLSEFRKSKDFCSWPPFDSSLSSFHLEWEFHGSIKPFTLP